MPFRDLNHPIETGMPVYPGDPTVSVERTASLADDGYQVSSVRFGSHAGTHVDAPSHLIEDGRPIDDVPVDRFVFDAHVVDVTDLASRSPIGLDALPDAVDEAVDLILFHTGWDRHWGDDRYLDHPHLLPAVAAKCVERGWSVGIDAPSPDPSRGGTDVGSAERSEGHPAHRLLLSNDLVIVENLTRLGGLKRCTVYAFPLPIVGGDGSPVRAVAEHGGR